MRAPMSPRKKRNHAFAPRLLGESAKAVSQAAKVSVSLGESRVAPALFAVHIIFEPTRAEAASCLVQAPAVALAFRHAACAGR